MKVFVVVVMKEVVVVGIPRKDEFMAVLENYKNYPLPNCIYLTVRRI